MERAKILRNLDGKKTITHSPSPQKTPYKYKTPDKTPGYRKTKPKKQK